ncbi:hypothetical protein [Mesorhizobium amorphae]|uniref:Uncharacterized protein n=1 Tax=Mesorhizobium amorphae CCNWGS0123 TaxID=1082933 RepID=G6YME0_9HYPH|nr:hypothetical protein [Mesorhizobium amorphae]ANT54499.1 hypothetical protein A6B35_31190 [Mesorhizobium amorphae CCNWGS0123]EHH02148.1 hypothetical protein MEA186_35989 [Mesorhizobium amorphae CCNWGS0123]
MQHIADHIVRSRSGPFEAIPIIDRDIRAVKWRLWHGRVGPAIRDLEQLTSGPGNERRIAIKQYIGLDGAP